MCASNYVSNNNTHKNIKPYDHCYCICIYYDNFIRIFYMFFLCFYLFVAEINLNMYMYLLMWLFLLFFFTFC